jgi:hypothetical protein
MEPTRLLGPIEPDDRFGPTWTTEFSWSLDTDWLAVQSCAETGCRTRLVDLAVGTTRELGDPSHGDVVGIAGARLILHQACDGLPCPLLSVDIQTGRGVALEDSAGQAVVVLDADGRPAVVREGDDDRMLWVSGVDGHDRRAVAGVLAGRRLVAGPARTGGAMEGAPDLIVLGPDGRLPADGSVMPIIQRLADGASGGLVEVSR